MTIVPSIGLGLRLATAGGRSAWVRLGLMALGFALGAALLLGALSVVPAVHARDERQFHQYARGRDHRSPNTLAIWSVPQAYGSFDVDGTAVRAVGSAPVPPGVPRIPAAGEIFVSPRLAELWNGPLGQTLERRLDGRLAGVVDAPAVVSPEDLRLWVGPPSGVAIPRSALYVTSFDRGPFEQRPLDLEAVLAMAGAAAAILLPIWLFVATATRLSSSTCEARSAAIRLAGGTQPQVRSLAAVEAAAAAAIGALCGIPLFLVSRPLVADGFILNIHLFPSDLTPPTWLAILGLAALPLLAAAITLFTMRRLVISPLGVTRSSRRSHASWWWLAVLATGVAVLLWAASRHAALVEMGSTAASVLILSGLACTAFGLIGTASWASWAVAGRLAARARSAAALLGLRRLEQDPSAAGRVVASVALVIASLAVMQAGLIAVEPDAAPAGLLAGWTDGHAGSTVVVSLEWPNRVDDALLRTVRGIRGVSRVTATHRLVTGGRNTDAQTLVVQTEDVSRVLELVRDDIAWTAQAHTLDQLRDRARYVSAAASMRRALAVITTFLLLVCAATMLVALVDWIVERRRALAVLSAVGVSKGTLRRSILIQVGLPLATAVVLGAAGGLVVSVLLYTATEIDVVLPVRTVAGLAALVGLAALAVTALSFPWVRASQRPEYLREA